MKSKKAIWLASLIVVVSISLLGLLVAFRKDDVYNIELEGYRYQVVEVFEDYTEAGAKVYKNDEVNSSIQLIVDDSTIDTSKVGLYYVKYSVKEDPELEVIRTVSVMDKTKPELQVGEFESEITENEEFVLPEYSASDNYDGDLTEKVKIKGEVLSDTPGVYPITFEVEDSSFNYTSKIIEITVIESVEESADTLIDKVGNRDKGKPTERPTTIPPKTGVGDKVVDDSENIGSIPDKKPETARNEMLKMSFTNNGISFSGVNDNLVTTVGLMSNNKVVSTFRTSLSGKQYSGNINTNNLPNGVYTLVAVNLNNQALVDKNSSANRITSAKVGNKFITVTYPNNVITIKVENNIYKYDIAINVGHGGTDSGAIGNGYIEKEVNLMVSQYEKARYEEHGLKVYLSRYSNDTYGDVKGDSSLARLTRSAISFGEVASESRVAYSNHHNSSTNKNSSGWETIVAANASRSQLSIQHRLSGLWNNVYRSLGSRGKIYTRDYQNGKVYMKNNGEVYNFKNYYAIIRVPFENNKQYVTLYEMAFLSNKANMDWYMKNEKWIDVAEAKIQAYVEGLGLKYHPPGFIKPEDKITYGPNRNIDTIIPFKTVIIEDAEKEAGTEGILTPGKEGLSRKVVRDVFTNGVKTDTETVEAEKVITEVTDEVKWVGIKEVIEDNN